MPASRTACSRSTPTPGRCRSPRSSSTPSCRIDSFFYYGTDDLYLNYLARFVKPGGPVGIAGAGLMREIEGAGPRPPSRVVDPGPAGACTRRPGGGGTGSGPASWTSSWPTPCPTAGGSGWTGTRRSRPTTRRRSQALEADRGRYLGYVRVVGRRRADARAGGADRVRARAVHEEAVAPRRRGRIGDGRAAVRTRGRDRQRVVR